MSLKIIEFAVTILLQAIHLALNLRELKQLKMYKAEERKCKVAGEVGLS